MIMMNKYSYDDKLVIREFFEQTVPTFPFRVYAPPFYKVDTDNIIDIKTLCRHIVDPYSYGGQIHPELDRFLTNLANTKPGSLCTFEQEIMQSQGYISLMYIYDASRSNLENTIMGYTRQYLDIKGYLDNPEGIVYSTILPVMISPPTVIRNQPELTNCAHRFIETIKNADLHKVVIVAANSYHLIFSLSEILALSYFGFDINPPPQEKRSVSYMDYDEYMNAVECWGMEKIILPAFVFEAPTKC